MTKKYVIWDLDGTIADNSHRLPLIDRNRAGGPDWEAFYQACDKDIPIEEGVAVLRLFWKSDKYKNIFLTGRKETVRDKTRAWLRKVLEPIQAEITLLMRPEKDHRPDYQVKAELIEKAGIKPEEIVLAFDDRNQVVDMWRKKGVACYQVKDGDY